MARPLLITAMQLMQISIFTDKEKMRRARGAGQIKMVKHKWYDLNKIHSAFLINNGATINFKKG